MQRTTFRNIAVSSAAALALGIAGPSATALDHGAAAKTASATARAGGSGTTTIGTGQDGRDIFAGLFFVQGEIGQQFAGMPEYTEAEKNYEANNTAEAKAAADRVMDVIAEADPEFFAGYSSDLRSGDPRKVEAGMADAVTLLNKLADEDAKELGTGDAKCVVSVLAVQSLVVVTTGGAAAVSVAVVAQAWKWVVNASRSTTPGSSDLEKDQKIADITRLLAGA
ncbi:sporulation delaying protein family toxin [Streptomyces sp. HUAS MG91]|uniref:Sporulation delaying protein family toxin n=1 Tax=Streptomyces tabacisoli TaxID=3156398 RepID=A0AAU8J0K5_9ACTN